jgi:hypothetical protein
VVWDCLIVGLLWLHHIESLTNVTMAVNACNLLYSKNVIRVLLVLGIKRVWISFEPLGRFSCSQVYLMSDLSEGLIVTVTIIW